MSMGDDELRKIAKRRLKSQASFKHFLAVFVAVSVLLVAVWAFTGGWGDYFWPIWPILGMGIAAIFLGLDAYGPGNHITEDRIEAEVRRMRGHAGSPSPAPGAYPTAPSATQVSPPHPWAEMPGQYPQQATPPASAPGGPDQHGGYAVPPQPPLPAQEPERAQDQPQREDPDAR